MDQSQTLTVNRPEQARPAALERADAQNEFHVRPADLLDVPALELIESEAFPTLFPSTRFANELKRPNAGYYVATRPASSREDGTQKASGAGGRRDDRPWLQRAIGSILFRDTGRRSRTRPHEYIAGFVGLWFVLDEAHIVIIGSRPRDRRRGIGELLLISAIEAAMKRGSRLVTLEVRESNQAARALYRKYGFREVGLRKRYYADNQEDAVIMTTPPIQSEEYWRHFHPLTRDHAARWGESGRMVS